MSSRIRQQYQLVLEVTPCELVCFLLDRRSRLSPRGRSGAREALYIAYPGELDNGAGNIYGGGGGGGGAYDYNANNYYRAGGGGGAGSNGGAGTSSTTSDGKSSAVVQPSDGTTSAGGSKGYVTINGYTVSGGNGGGLGAAGATGMAFTYSGFTKAAFAGGAAGAAITKNGNAVTITAGNDTTRIKGAVA